eukprot:CAMPEP_0172535416 /NCGR_PEP_ID=MMETSP1067-20121228/7435_1 /TAXON_ID=265564 ORGANISM="Thalassiosira punctigera, Strain Tpunct2005C2" /NCGR_SAMPLE_ID=MMETSP1067 /ASSEMBLY_ACC=CAM_ASM_000444 /LENGTH=252 /DNA_ID=CAMNT_0013320349 /DNA_START=200 /DNA_END=955 /DNA_ORIENTATION=-
MCNNTTTLTRRNRSHESAVDLLPPVTASSLLPPLSSVKNLQPYNTKSPVGTFTSKVTSPQQIITKHGRIDARKCLVAHVGLENFIRNIALPLDLKLPDEVKFNMNGRGRIRSWEEVYLAERVYTKCLGISKRIYQTHAFTHEPDRKLAYFILEEHNERSLSFLPGFDFFVLVFTYYDDDKNVTRVEVQYDQLSFFLHCMGLAQGHAWVTENLITPFALAWAKAFYASGLANPFTFVLQLLLVPCALIYWFLW